MHTPVVLVGQTEGFGILKDGAIVAVAATCAVTAAGMIVQVIR